MEEFEFRDWNITPLDSLTDRRNKSISAYYLHKWYHKVEYYTFPTVIYPLKYSPDTSDPENIYQVIVESLPEKLPYEKCMVRYEHKSPKDSPFWGPVQTNEEVAKLFATSLTLQKDVGKMICVREWVEIISEYRCFWKNKPNVIESLNDLDEDQCQKILDYLEKRHYDIPYERCVIDIAKTSKKFKIIEFNSWETLSRGYYCDWTEDTEILDAENNQVVFRSPSQNFVFEWKYIWYGSNGFSSWIDPSYKILRPSRPSCWLITDRYIYICSEIWLGQFTLEGKNVGWKRGQYRFSFIYPCDLPNYIFIGDHQNPDEGIFLDECLKPVSEYLEPFPKINFEVYQKEDILPVHSMYRYGCICINQGQLEFCRMWNDGTFN